MPDRPDIAILFNPIAGRGRGPALLDEFEQRATTAGHRCTRLVTRRPDEAPLKLEDAVSEETVVAVAGGDGTIRSVLPMLLHRPNPLLLLPVGTENLLAQHLGIRPDCQVLLDVLHAGRARPMDAAMNNGCPFITVLGVGFDAEVVERLSRIRKGHISHFDYVWPFLETFRKYSFPPVRVVADGEEICDEPALVFVGNISRYAIGLQILRDAEWDDGLLDLCVMRCRHHGRLLKHALHTVLRQHVEHRLVTYRRARSIDVSAEQPLFLQTDGDPAGCLPARVEVIPAAIRVLVP